MYPTLGGHGAGHPSHTLLGAVQEPELQRVHSQLLAQLVDGGLHGEGRCRSARRPVGRGLGPVDDHVVGHQVRVGNVILGHHALGARRDRRAGEGPGLVDQRRLGRDHLAFPGGAELDLDLGAGGGTGGLEDFLAGHLHLDRVAALAGQKRRHGLHVDHGLCAKAAADFQRDGLDVGHRDAHEPGGVVAHGELALAAGPDGQFAVGTPLRGAGVGFDIALVYRNRLGFLLNDYIGLLETLFHVAEAELELVGDVAARAVLALVQQSAGAQRRVGQAGQPLMHGRRAGFHRLIGAEHRGEDLVVHLDQGQSLFGYVRTGSGYGSHGVAFVQHLAPGQHVHAEEPEVLDRTLGQVRQASGSLGPVGGRDDGVDTGVGLGRAGVNGPDSGVRMGAAQNLAVQQARQVLVGSIACPPGNFSAPSGRIGRLPTTLNSSVDRTIFGL